MRYSLAAAIVVALALGYGQCYGIDMPGFHWEDLSNARPVFNPPEPPKRHEQQLTIDVGNARPRPEPHPLFAQFELPRPKPEPQSIFEQFERPRPRPHPDLKPIISQFEWPRPKPKPKPIVPGFEWPQAQPVPQPIAAVEISGPVPYVPSPIIAEGGFVHERPQSPPILTEVDQKQPPVDSIIAEVGIAGPQPELHPPYADVAISRPQPEKQPNLINAETEKNNQQDNQDKDLVVPTPKYPIKIKI